MAQTGYLKAGDTISGTEGKITAIIKGNIEELMNVVKYEATVEKNKEEMKVIGYRGTQHKATGFSASGTMSVYTGNPLFNELMSDYVNNGKDHYFDMMVTTKDNTSETGQQTVLLTGVNIDSAMIANLNAENEMLMEDVPFTFSGYQLVEKFKKLNY